MQPTDPIFVKIMAYTGVLAEGVLLTLEIFIVAFFISLIFGLIIGSLRLSQYKILRVAAGAYCALFRSVPELIVILGVYFGGAMLLAALGNTIPYANFVVFTPYTAGVLALSIAFSAYIAEIIRSSILSVDKGEIEAGYAFGLSRWQVYHRIIMPQLWQYALPGVGNVGLVLLKDTSLLSVIGLNELMRSTKVAIGYTAEPFAFYLTAAILYLLMTSGGLWVLRILQRRTHCEEQRHVF